MSKHDLTEYVTEAEQYLHDKELVSKVLAYLAAEKHDLPVKHEYAEKFHSHWEHVAVKIFQGMKLYPKLLT